MDSTGWPSPNGWQDPASVGASPRNNLTQEQLGLTAQLQYNQRGDRTNHLSGLRSFRPAPPQNTINPTALRQGYSMPSFPPNFVPFGHPAGEYYHQYVPGARRVFPNAHAPSTTPQHLPTQNRTYDNPMPGQTNYQNNSICASCGKPFQNDDDFLNVCMCGMGTPHADGTADQSFQDLIDLPDDSNASGSTSDDKVHSNSGTGGNSDSPVNLDSDDDQRQDSDSGEQSNLQDSEDENRDGSEVEQHDREGPEEDEERGQTSYDHQSAVDPEGDEWDTAPADDGEQFVEDSASDRQDDESDEESEPLMECTEPFMKRFAGPKEASNFIGRMRHFVTVKNDDVQEVEDAQEAYAEVIHNAMRTLPRDASESDKTSFQQIINKKYEPDYFEARSYDVVGRVIRLHDHGSMLLSSQLSGKTIEQCKASDRLEILENLLLNNKNVVKDILDGWKVALIVAEPSKRLTTTKSTRSCNMLRKVKKKKQAAKVAKQEATIAEQLARIAELEAGMAARGPVKQSKSRSRASSAQHLGDSEEEQMPTALGDEDEDESELSSEDDLPRGKSQKTTGRGGASGKGAPQKTDKRASRAARAGPMADPSGSRSGNKRKRHDAAANGVGDDGDEVPGGRITRMRRQ